MVVSSLKVFLKNVLEKKKKKNALKKVLQIQK